MANFGYVKAKTKITNDTVNSCLKALNERVFKNKLKFTIGKNCWEVELADKETVYATKSIWMESPRCLAIRHGGGGDIAWWLDFAITNEIALAVDGIITDDGVEDKSKPEPNKYDSFKAFQKTLYPASWLASIFCPPLPFDLK